MHHFVLPFSDTPAGIVTDRNDFNRNAVGVVCHLPIKKTWYGLVIFLCFIGAMGNIVSFVLFGYIGIALWSLALDRRHYPAFVLSSGFWMFAVGMPWCGTLAVLGTCHWIKSSVVTALGGPVVHIGLPVAGGLLMLGFAMEAFMTKEPSKKT